MAFDSQALTLAEWAQNSNDPVVRKFTKSFYEGANLIEDIPFRTNTAVKYRGKRIDGTNVGTVDYRDYEEEPVVTKGGGSDFQEQIYLIRNRWQADVDEIADPNLIMDPFKLQYMIWKANFTWTFNTNFIDNSVNGDPKAPVGLRARLDNPTLYGTNTNNKVDFGGCDLSGTVTNANANLFISLLDTVLYSLDAYDGNNVVLYMNETLISRFAWAVRTLGNGAGFSSVKDAYDRTVPTYRGAKIKNVGRRSDQVTPVIKNTETIAGAAGSSNYTSLYAVRYGDDYFSGIQNKIMAPKYLGVDPTTGVAENVVLNWGYGFFCPNTRSIARGFGIKIS